VVQNNQYQYILQQKVQRPAPLSSSSPAPPVLASILDLCSIHGSQTQRHDEML
jgi:hypothetical protein